MFNAYGTAYASSGTYEGMGVTFQRADANPCMEVALMGTYAVGNNFIIDNQLRDRATGVLVHEPVTAHTALIAMLLARPELKLCESYAAK